MILLISIFISDKIKNKRWRMWEYRGLWKDARKIFPGFQSSFEAVKVMMITYELIERYNRERKD